VRRRHFPGLQNGLDGRKAQLRVVGILARRVAFKLSEPGEQSVLGRDGVGPQTLIRSPQSIPHGTAEEAAQKTITL
jgi:hypothetical protein